MYLQSIIDLLINTEHLKPFFYSRKLYNTNISHELFHSKITFVNSQHENTITNKSDFDQYISTGDKKSAKGNCTYALYIIVYVFVPTKKILANKK